jgi:hypothetical protein
MAGEIMSAQFMSQSAGPDQWVEQINKYYAVTERGNNVVILHETGAGPQFLPLRDFCLLLQNAVVVINGKTTPVVPLWLQSAERRQYTAVVFEPGGCAPDQYNLWKGLRGVEPQEGEWPLIGDHLFKVIAGGDALSHDYLVKWLAHMVQRPGEKPGVAMALCGKKGTGKGVFVSSIVGGLMADDLRVQVDKPEHLTGRFNKHLQAKLLIFADEAFFAGDRSVVGALNGIITERNQILEAKGQDAITVKSCCRLILATNEEWVVRASRDERRFFMLRVSDGHMQDRAYFTNLLNSLTSELPGFLHHLLNVDLTGFDPFNCPKTSVLDDQVELSRDTFQQWADQLKTDGKFSFNRNGLGQEVLIDLSDPTKLMAVCSDVHQSYREFATMLRELRPLGPSPFGVRVTNHWEGKVKRVRRRQGKDEEWVYDFSRLQSGPTEGELP